MESRNSALSDDIQIWKFSVFTGHVRLFIVNDVILKKNLFSAIALTAQRTLRVQFLHQILHLFARKLSFKMTDSDIEMVSVLDSEEELDLNSSPEEFSSENSSDWSDNSSDMSDDQQPSTSTAQPQRGRRGRQRGATARRQAQ